MNTRRESRQAELAELERQGVDMTLVREMLRATPDQRLARHQQMLDLVGMLRDARQRTA